MLAALTPATARDNGTWTQPYTGTYSTSAGVFNVTNSGSGSAIEGTSSSGNGLYGQSSSSAGVSGLSTTSDGVYGESGGTSSQGSGVYGYDSSTGAGVYGENGSTGVGVYGYNSSSGAGVYAVSNSGGGVEGFSTSGTGMYGSSSSGVAIYGTSTNNYGVSAQTSNSSYAGVFGYNTNSTSGNGVTGSSNGSGGNGVEGDGNGGTSAAGVYGVSTSGGTGVIGQSGGTYSNVTGSGLHGIGSTYGVYGTGPTGVHGSSSSAYGSGVYGISSGSAAFGVYGSSSAGDGIYGTSSAGGYGGIYAAGTGSANVALYATGGTDYVATFNGDINVLGTVYKDADDFKIDDPVDPGNKYLVHCCVESNEMINIYRGSMIFDSEGRAIVTMPSWFQAENMDFNYQLTCIGKSAPVYISKEIANNQFELGGGLPGLKVCWVVTGARHDPWAAAHPLVVEQDKRGAERGKYRNPEVYGNPKSAGIGYMINAPAERREINRSSTEVATKYRSRPTVSKATLINVRRVERPIRHIGH